MQRRLAAILAADVVGYSRLIRADEEGTLAALKALRGELVNPRIAQHHGRIVKLMGDGMLAEFPSAVDAVRCAAEVQRALAERNADVAEEKRVAFRVGINLGDVVIDGDDIHGDGVNVAARLEGLAEPGGICVSGKVYEEVRDRTDLAFEDMGEQELKNIDRPMRVWRWVSDAGAVAATSISASESLARLDRPSIAVLPFINMSGDPEQEYFSDGITEEIITALTHWRSFPIIARNSTFTYKNKPVDIKKVGRELGARYLLQGSVRKGGRRVRITAQLIDGANGHHLWAEKYDRELDDIFAVQDEIAQRIAATVAPEMAKAEVRHSATKRPEDFDAWDYYLRGMALIHERTCEGNAKARELFKTAISIQSDYADAYAGLAMSYNNDVVIQCAEDGTATATQAMEAARRAVKYDEVSAIAHNELSTAYQLLNRPDDALAEARLAVNLNPNDAYALHALGNKSDLAGDGQGITFMEKAQNLNPQDAQLHTHLTYLARAYLNAGSYEDAVDRARQAIRRRSDYPPAYYILALALGHLGRGDEGRAALSKCDELHPGFVRTRENWQPYADPRSNEKLRASFLQLGFVP